MRTTRKQDGKKSIFRSIFVPLFLLMVLQAAIFYLAAVYGGIEDTLERNAADILSERLLNRTTEIETQLNNKCFNLKACVGAIEQRYADWERTEGETPFINHPATQIAFLSDCSDLLIDTLRQTETNGIFLILNDLPTPSAPSPDQPEKKYGLCVRDMDQDSSYFGREDLLVERSPSSLVGTLGCTLDSWWEAWYTFTSETQSDYYYYPLNAAWENPRAEGVNLAYCSGARQTFGSDRPVISYSIPLMSEDGYPFGVVGVELTTQYLASLMPSYGWNDSVNPSYMLAMQDVQTEECTPIVGTGTTYAANFGANSVFSCAATTRTGGFNLTGRTGAVLYGDDMRLNLYNNNNPFEGRQLTLLAFVERGVMLAHIDRIKLTLLLVSLMLLALDVAGILLVSRRFAAPITALANRVRDMSPQEGFRLDRLGISEIDQLVDAIEELNRNVSRSSARTEFFSRMSHDMRTPMNAIISFSSPEMLAGIDEATKDDYLQKIHTSGDFLLGLINEVLDMTKIESRNTELRLAPKEASRLCDTIVPIIQKLAQKKGVRFTHAITADSGTYVLVDAQYFDQIVMNLLSNAVKFTPEGGDVRLTMSVSPDSGDAARSACQIVVSDTGIGMSETFLKRLYMPFEQESGEQEGTGLGLSIARRLVELMRGTIRCDSQKDVGTTFTISLAFQNTDAPAEAPAANAPLSSRADLKALKGKRVLLCEDNAINAQIVSILLGRVGVRVDVAVNGQAGADAFAASPPHAFDAVLMDVRMPVLDGFAATRLIRAMDRPDAATVPIIAMTANAFDEDVQASRDAGMNEHLSKPIETDKFFAVLLRYMGEGAKRA